MNERTASKKPWYRLRNLILGALVLIVLLLGWAFLEVWKVYTGEPKITRDYRAEFRRTSEKAAGVPEGSGDEAWEKFIEATSRCNEIIRKYEQRISDGEVPARKLPDDSFEDPTVMFELVRHGTSIPRGLDREREVIQLLRDQGVLVSLAEFAAMSPGFRNADNSVSMLEQLMPELSQARGLAKARAASMRLALEKGDHAEIARAVDELLAMSRTLSHQPGLICTLVGLSINALTLNELRIELLESEFDEASCRALLRSFDRHPNADATLALKGEQAAFHDFTQRFFTDNGRGNGYINAKTLQAVSGNATFGQSRSFGGALIGRFVLPSRMQTEARYDQFVELCLQELALPPAKRGLGTFDSDRFITSLGRREAIVKLMIPAVEKCFDSIAMGQQTYEAARVMVALELFHALHKRWPDSLDELAPSILPQLPRDPLHGGAFGYRLLENDSRGWPYLLYSFGLDEADDGGKQLADENTLQKALTDRSQTGYDFIFNIVRMESLFETMASEGEDASGGAEADGTTSEEPD